MDKHINVHIKGVAPLICHNVRLSDPLDEWAKAVAEISSKRKKTEADHEELAYREFMGGLYMGDNGPVVPGGNIEKMFREAAAKQRKGKDVQAGLIVLYDAPIIYQGPKDPQKMWEDGRYRFRHSVGVERKRIMRTRPFWTEWELKFRVDFSSDVLNKSSVIDFLGTAGNMVGLCDWRPKHGRFTVLRAE